MGFFPRCRLDAKPPYRMHVTMTVRVAGSVCFCIPARHMRSLLVRDILLCFFLQPTSPFTTQRQSSVILSWQIRSLGSDSGCTCSIRCQPLLVPNSNLRPRFPPRSRCSPMGSSPWCRIDAVPPYRLHVGMIVRAAGRNMLLHTCKAYAKSRHWRRTIVSPVKPTVSPTMISITLAVKTKSIIISQIIIIEPLTRIYPLASHCATHTSTTLHYMY